MLDAVGLERNVLRLNNYNYRNDLRNFSKDCYVLKDYGGKGDYSKLFFTIKRKKISTSIIRSNFRTYNSHHL